MSLIIKLTTDSETAYAIACQLPDYFDASGLADIKTDSKNHILYGAYLDDKMIGFATYKEYNHDVIEMTWLGISPSYQGNRYGEELVSFSLENLSKSYRFCKVKTLAETDSYEPYKNTRDFYQRMGFVSVEIISPYPGWGDNPCQIFVKTLR